MPRLQPISKANADANSKPLLDAVEKKMGKVPNILATMANAPAVLKSYLGFSGALAEGTLPAKLREQIALTVAEANHCEYCLAAHSALGRKAGLSDEEIVDSRRGSSPDRKADAVITFARRIVAEKGFVSDEDVQEVRAAGFGDAEIAEITANVALSIFTNYFNHVVDTESDFPKVESLATSAV